MLVSSATYHKHLSLRNPDHLGISCRRFGSIVVDVAVTFAVMGSVESDGIIIAISITHY